METLTTNTISSASLLNVITRKKNNAGATFTIKSKKTGKEFTYKIARKEWKGKWYTHISVEKQYNNFVYLGSYFNAKIYRKGGEVNTPAAIGISFILKFVELEKFDYIDFQAEIMHTGNCLCCGKLLTDSDSIKLGLGPICSQFN